MGFDSVTAVLIAVAFFVPGFILAGLLATTFRRRAESASSLALQYLTLSCVNHGLWSWLVVLIFAGEWVERRPITVAILVFVILFVSPIALGLLALSLSQRAWIQRLLSGFGFKIQRFIPTAWDFTFQRESPSWVMARLKDGSTVCGYFGEESFAGDDPRERDLFIEAVFTLTDGGEWQPQVDTAGILLKASEIATIEFRRLDETEGAA